MMHCYSTGLALLQYQTMADVCVHTGAPHKVSLPEFIKFFEAVARVRGDKSAASLVGHVEKGVPAWRERQG